MFTEDYQVDFLREHHHVFDDLRKTYLSGEMVWNFADFMTGQGTRVRVCALCTDCETLIISVFVLFVLLVWFEFSNFLVLNQHKHPLYM